MFFFKKSISWVGNSNLIPHLYSQFQFRLVYNQIFDE